MNEMKKATLFRLIRKPFREKKRIETDYSYIISYQTLNSVESLKTSASLGEICKPWKLPGVLCIPNTLQQFSESFKGHTTVILNDPTLPALDYILAQHI